jgi:peptide-methionine (S)-S-oxide reductase
MSSDREHRETEGLNETATLGGGCFWCTEAVFSELKGVKKVEPGYCGGNVQDPTYEQVCADTTGHAEVVQIEFDPRVISFLDLLRVFFTIHDPTTMNRQGNDVGTQYRSVIFYHNDEQKLVAKDVMKQISEEKIWGGPLVTQVVRFDVFFPAEEYHRDYFKRNPNQGYCQVIIAPKVAKFRKHYLDMLKAK